MTESFLLDLLEKGEKLINDPIFFKDIQHFRCRLFDLGVGVKIKNLEKTGIIQILKRKAVKI